MVTRPTNPNEEKSHPERKAPLDFDAVKGAKEPKVKRQEPGAKPGAVKFLTPEELIEWKKDIEAGIAYQKMDSRWERWHEYLDYLNCRWDNIYDDDDDHHCNVNSIFANLQAEIPTLYFQQPDVSVISKKPTFKRKVQTQQGEIEVNVDNQYAAKLLGLRLNQVFGDCVMEPTVERYIADAKAPYGGGWIKVGYGFTSEFEPDLDQEVTKTTYWVARVDPRNMIVPCLTTDMTKRDWTAERIIRKKKDLEANSLYIQDKVKNMKTGIPETLKSRFDRMGHQYDVKLTEFYEVHDHKNKCLRWIAIDGEPCEIREPVKRKDFVEGSDYEYMDLNIPTDDSAYALSDVEPVIDQAIARNKVRTAQTKHIENWGITVFTESTFFKDDETEEEWRTLGNGIGICKVKDGALNQNKMTIVQPPSIPADWFNMDQVYKRDNDETLGISPAMQGKVTDATKAEIQTVSQSTGVRIGRQRRKIKLALVNVAKKMASLIRAHDDAATVLDVSDYKEDDGFMDFLQKNFDFDGSVGFLEVDKTAWQGQYNFDFEVEEMLDRPKAVQVQQRLATWQSLSKIPQFMAVLDDEADARYVLNDILMLQGMRLESLSKPAAKPMLPAEFENMLADGSIGEEGPVEIPPPNEKDLDDYHLVTHGTLREELKKAVPNLMKGAMAGDTQALEAYNIVKLSLRFIEEHMLMHSLSKQKKAKKREVLGKASSGGQQNVNGPNMAGPGPRMAAPSAEGIAQNAGAAPMMPPQPGGTGALPPAAPMMGG